MGRGRRPDASSPSWGVGQRVLNLCCLSSEPSSSHDLRGARPVRGLESAREGRWGPLHQGSWTRGPGALRATTRLLCAQAPAGPHLRLFKPVNTLILFSTPQSAGQPGAGRGIGCINLLRVCMTGSDQDTSPGSLSSQDPTEQLDHPLSDSGLGTQTTGG